jgi:hypothetical protein
MPKLARLLCATTLCAPCISGCATVVPKFDVPYYPAGAVGGPSAPSTPSTAAITREIECELYNLVRNDVPPDQQYPLRGPVLTRNFQVAMLLNLDVTDTGGLAPSANFPASTMFAFNAAAELQQAREDSLGIGLAFSLKDDLFNAPPAKKTDLSTCPITSPEGFVATNLAGNLGLKEKVTAALATKDVASSTSTPTPTSGEFSGVINFTLTKNVNAVGPTWMLTHFKGPGNLASLSEVNNDKLNFAFAETKPSSPMPAAKTAAKKDSQMRAQALLDRQIQIDLTTLLSNIRSGQ